MPREEIIRIRDVSFSYDARPFLQHIDLTIYADDFLGIIGPNGGGKTTLLKLILGMNVPALMLSASNTLFIALSVCCPVLPV